MTLQNGGQDPTNWISKTGKSHLFDCVKYAYLARDFALQTFKRSFYRFGKAPSVMRRFEKMKKREDIAHQVEAKRTSWWQL